MKPQTFALAGAALTLVFTADAQGQGSLPRDGMAAGRGFVAPLASSPGYAAVTFHESDGILRVFNSADGITFNEASESYQDAGPSPLRDPTILYYQGKYWCAYTTGAGITGVFGLANSTDGLAWTKVGNIAVPIGNLVYVWAPSWFVDTDASVHLVLSVQTGASQSLFYFIEMHPTHAAMTAWSAPVTVYSTSKSMIDPFIIHFGSEYYLWYKNDTDKYIETAASTTSAFTGYLPYHTGDWNGWGHGNTTGRNNGYEAPCVLQLTNGSFILYADSSISQGIVYSTSPDGLHGWSPFQLATFNNPNGYTMSGPDVRPMAIVALPVQNPVLQIQLSGTNVVLSWPWVPPAGVVLETTGDLTATNPWTTVSNLPAFHGVQFTATNPVADGNRFYRLTR